MEDILSQIKTQISSHPILLYMKGTPEAPQCGFSAQTVQILATYGKPFAYVNILENPDIRRELPRYAQWPTFPQLYINGELIGGCDIVADMHQNAQLETMLNSASKQD